MQYNIDDNDYNDFSTQHALCKRMINRIYVALINKTESNINNNGNIF